MVPILTLLAAIFTTWRATKYYMAKRQKERDAVAQREHEAAERNPTDPPAPSI